MTIYVKGHMMDCRYHHVHYYCVIMNNHELLSICIMFICRHMCSVIWGWQISKNDGNKAQSRVYITRSL